MLLWNKGVYLADSSLYTMATDRAFDVIVIGAGVEGSATAYQLTKLAREKRVALVEQVGPLV